MVQFMDLVTGALEKDTPREKELLEAARNLIKAFEDTIPEELEYEFSKLQDAVARYDDV